MLRELAVWNMSGFVLLQKRGKIFCRSKVALMLFDNQWKQFVRRPQRWTPPLDDSVVMTDARVAPSKVAENWISDVGSSGSESFKPAQLVQMCCRCFLSERTIKKPFEPIGLLEKIKSPLFFPLPINQSARTFTLWTPANFRCYFLFIFGSPLFPLTDFWARWRFLFLCSPDNVKQKAREDLQAALWSFYHSMRFKPCFWAGLQI